MSVDQLERIDRDQLATLAGPVHDLYRQCFAEPPWHESAERFASFPEVLAAQLTRPGVSGIVIRDTSALAGVIYGWAAPAKAPRDPLHRALAEQVPKSVRHDLLAPAVVVGELMVHPAWRGNGLGRALLASFVGDHPCAWLLTHPEAPARALYESAGWQLRAGFTNQFDEPRVIYTWAAQRSSSGSLAS